MLASKAGSGATCFEGQMGEEETKNTVCGPCDR